MLGLQGKTFACQSHRAVRLPPSGSSGAFQEVPSHWFEAKVLFLFPPIQDPLSLE